MNIYLHEFRAKLRSVITWSISLAALVTLFMSIYSSFSAQSALLTEAMAQMPPQLLMAFGIQDVDFSAVLGFYGLIFLFCQICLAIQAANYGFGLVSIEESELTADFLLAKPVSRTSILTSKFLAALTALTVTNLVVWVSTYAAIALFTEGREYDGRALLLLLLSIIIFQLFFLSVGAVISLLMKRVRSVTSVSMALAFGLYLLNAFSGMLGKESLDLLTPFKHFEPNFILANAAYDMPFVLLNVSITVLSIVGSYLLYARRNIAAAV